MSRSTSAAVRWIAAAGLVCMPLLLSAGPAGAQLQTLRRVVSRTVEVLNAQLAAAVADDGPEDAPRAAPRSLRRCGTLYDQRVREVAEGPELVRSYTRWINESFKVIEQTDGLPLPVCFEWRSDSVDTNLARTLLHVNNAFMLHRFSTTPASELERRYWSGYVLTGHTDPQESDTVLARGRAEEIQARSPGPPCRFVVRIDPRETTKAFYRKVTYSYQPAVRSCPRAPR